LAANPPNGFGAHSDKKDPMPTVKYTAGLLIRHRRKLIAVILAKRG